jgi:hypothetical protein
MARISIWPMVTTAISSATTWTAMGALSPLRGAAIIGG